MTAPSRPRKRPCPTCPYRRDVPSGVWAAAEYDLLERYDGDTAQQAMAGATAVFGCHQATGEVCAGWAHVHGNEDCLALRLAHLASPPVDVDAVLDYTTSVPLFASGAEAAAHGRAGITDPGDQAQAAIRKVAVSRALRGQPVQFDRDPRRGR